MREKVMLLAQGRFVYEQPDIVLSADELVFDVPEEGMATAAFRIKNALKTRIKGFCATDEFDIEFLPVFDGKDSEITVKVHAGNRSVGDVITGDIYIITDCGERELPYRITVVGRHLEGSFGQISTYGEFVRYAQEHFDEAVQLFFREQFKKRYLNEMWEKRLYQHLTQKNPKKQALEEFLVAHGDKKPVRFAVNKKQLSFEVEDEDVAGEVVVVKDCWGALGIRVVSDQEFLTVDREYLHEADFDGNQMAVLFRIHASQVAPGRHSCRISFENVHQRLEVVIQVHQVRGAEERSGRRMRKKLCAKLVRCHIQQMMNSSLRAPWLRLLEENREELLDMCRGSEMQLTGYINYIAGNEAGMSLFVRAVEGMEKPKQGDESDRVYEYAFSVYLRARISRTKEDREEALEQIRYFYGNGYRHWMLLVLLERLGVYEGNPVGLLEELDVLWEEGCASPYLHLYRMLLLLQDVELLRSLDARTTGALRFGLNHDLITGDIVMAVSVLAVRKRKCTPALLSFLERCYDIFGSRDTLQCICALLIRSERQEPKYFKWFQLGVENSLRITELFEYYMYTMERERFDEALSSVISFFKYENHLRDSVKTSFYSSIVRNREEHPEYFQAYRDVIRSFVLEQLLAHRVSDELAVLYEVFLPHEEIKGRLAKELPYVLFSCHIICENRRMERVVVVHDEGGSETKYNLVNGEAYINVVTPHFNLYFVDKNGFYHKGTVKFTLNKILNLDYLSYGCYENGSDHPLLLLHLFSGALEREPAEARDAIILHTMIRSDVPGMEYRGKALLALYEYYRAIGEDSLLEEVIGQIDFKYIDQEKRAGILQTMIQHKMNDEAMDVLKRYRITNCTLKLILLLITWKLEENEGRFEPYHVRLCDFLFRNGVSNAATLSYLANYYMGNTRHLLDIYRAAKRSGADIGDGGTERLLGQALFVSDDPEQYADAFLDYFDYGANRILVKAFLSYTAYEFLVGKCGLADGILDKIRKEGLSEDHHAMILAMLKYYSGQQEYSEAEEEYIVYHLSQCASMGRIMDFMKGFVGKVKVPFEIESSDIIQYYSSYRGEVYIEIEREDGTKSRQPMRRVFTDVYVHEALLFWGERITYCIYAGDMETPVKRGELAKGREEEPKGLAFYQLVNGMLRARETGDEAVFASLAGQYRCWHKIADELFSPL